MALVWSVLVWVWRVNPPVVTLLVLVVILGSTAVVMSGRDLRAEVGPAGSRSDVVVRRSG